MVCGTILLIFVFSAEDMKCFVVLAIALSESEMQFVWELVLCLPGLTGFVKLIGAVVYYLDVHTFLLGLFQCLVNLPNV
ncbi:uncharacterized protein SOCE26_040170 [Sorangium cellulosum]|uniref:Uncharacterized protein n=1 Tax=Sorangium cellulosum TaxID=56 RepID=A0A2L0ETI0_SORCE|nr:uncharacterized protein SOCE26_040170 [Sorangium cellulosum]